jgi:hypothetical protein
MTLTRGSVLWNGLPQSDNAALPTFSEKIRNSLNLSLYLHLSNISYLISRQFKNALSHCNTYLVQNHLRDRKITVVITDNVLGALLYSSLLKLFDYKVTRGGHFQLKYNNFVLPIA